MLVSHLFGDESLNDVFKSDDSYGFSNRVTVALDDDLLNDKHMGRVLDEVVQTVKSVGLAIDCSSLSQDLRNLFNSWVVSVRVHENEVFGHQNADNISPCLIEYRNSTVTLSIDRLHHFPI